MRLTSQQLDGYRSDGYLVIDGLIDDSTLDDLRRTIAEFQDRAKRVSASNELFDLGPGHTAATPKLRRIKHPTRQHRVFDDLMRSPVLADTVAQLLGGTVRFDHAKLNFKPAGGNAKIDWHQDWAFYPHTNDDLLALGVMIEDCTAENGPLMVIPGSHRGPLYNHHRGGIFVGAIDPVDLGAAAGRAVELTARAGSISIHHVRTVHASRDNLTATERPLLLLSYAAADAFPVFYGPDLAEFNARILRGAATLDARITDVPIRLPLPRAKGVGSIYDNQEMLARIAAGADLELDTMPERR